MPGKICSSVVSLTGNLLDQSLLPCSYHTEISLPKNRRVRDVIMQHSLDGNPEAALTACAPWCTAASVNTYACPLPNHVSMLNHHGESLTNLERKCWVGPRHLNCPFTIMAILEQSVSHLPSSVKSEWSQIDTSLDIDQSWPDFDALLDRPRSWFIQENNGRISGDSIANVTFSYCHHYTFQSLISVHWRSTISIKLLTLSLNWNFRFPRRRANRYSVSLPVSLSRRQSNWGQ